MSPTTAMMLAEIETKIAHLESAATHLVTYGLHEAAQVVTEIIGEAKAYAASLTGTSGGAADPAAEGVGSGAAATGEPDGGVEPHV